MARILQTDDLLLTPAQVELAENVLDYYLRNKNFLAEFEPRRENVFFSLDYQRNALICEQTQAAQLDERNALSGLNLAYYIAAKNNQKKIIGTIGLNQIVFGCFCSCYLGYKLDRQLLNRGYMTQAVKCISKMAFTELSLHRLEANVMPRNRASLRVLEKCGFQNEGLAKAYLKINGIWEDHLHMVKLNEQM